jgi:hypothetical protein
MILREFLIQLTIDISKLTTNTGIAKTIQDSVGNIIKRIDYPSFKLLKFHLSLLLGKNLFQIILKEI